LHAGPADDRPRQHQVHARMRKQELTTETQRHREVRKESWLLFFFSLCLCASVVGSSSSRGAEPPLEAGFGEADITPALGGKPVYLAGFGQNRKATEILDPLLVRAVVLRHGETKIAIASADLVGLFFTSVQRVRKELPGFQYVLVSSTHVHHGPDT